MEAVRAKETRLDMQNLALSGLNSYLDVSMRGSMFHRVLDPSFARLTNAIDAMIRPIADAVNAPERGVSNSNPQQPSML